MPKISEFERIYLKASALSPRRIIDHTRTLLKQAGIELPAREFTGFGVAFSAIVAVNALLAVNLIVEGLSPGILVLAAVIAFVATEALMYAWLIMSADSRARNIESLLPDMFQIVSANLRAGMTLENAIWSAARPELGPLRDEIKKVSAEAFGGREVATSLMDMTRRIRSVILERSMRLITEGIRLGGEMASLLDEVAADIRSTQMLQKEISTTTVTYAIFIAFASLIAAPLLFSVAVNYAEMNERINAQKVQVPGGGVGVGGAMGGASAIASKIVAGKKPSISASDVKLFAIGAIFITTFFGAFILALVRTGRWIQGVQYIPVFVIVGIAIFFAAYGVIGTLLTGTLR
jgi:flagellar protein FlaJ